MARFERQPVLQSIQHPYTSDIDATRQLQRTFEQFGQFAGRQYEQRRIAQVQEEAAEVTPSIDAPEKRTAFTKAGRAYNDVVMAGHASAIRNDYTANISSLQEQYGNDIEGFNSAIGAYQKSLISKVDPSLQNAVALDMEAALIRPRAEIQRKQQTEGLAEAVSQIGTAAQQFSDEAARAARAGDAESIPYYDGLIEELAVALEAAGDSKAAKTLRTKHADRMDEQLVLGGMERALEDGRGKEFLKGFKKSDHGLSPEQADILFSKMLTMWRQDKALKAADNAAARAAFNAGIADYKNYLSAGEEDSTEQRERFSLEALTEHYDDPEQARHVFDELEDARMLGNSLTSLYSAPNSERLSIIEENKPRSADHYSREARQYAALIKANDQINSALMESPADYAIAHNPGVKEAYGQLALALTGEGDLQAAIGNYLMQSRSFQEHMGVSPRSVQFLPQPMVAAIAGELSDLSDGGNRAALRLQHYESMFGTHWPVVRKQLEADKAIGGGVAVAAALPRHVYSADLLSALSVGKAGYKDLLDKDDITSIEADSSDKLEDFTDSIRHSQGSESIVREYRDAIETLSMKYLYDGRVSSTSDALELAYDRVIGDNFEFFKTPHITVSGTTVAPGTTSYRIPSHYRTDWIHNHIVKTVQRMRTGEIPVQVPPSSEISNQEDLRDVYLTNKFNPIPITNQDGDGVVFINQLSGQIVRDADGEIIERTFDEIEGMYIETPSALDTLMKIFE